MSRKDDNRVDSFIWHLRVLQKGFQPVFQYTLDGRWMHDVIKT